MASPPTWLIKLANDVAARVQPADLLAPLGCHFHFFEETRQWEVSIFVSQTHIVGGHLDGQDITSRFFVDLKHLSELFDEVTEFNWQAVSQGPEDEIGPHISVEGRFQAHNVWLRILAMPPQPFKTGRLAMAYEQSFKELW